MEEIIKHLKEKLENILNHLKNEIQTIRSGKVSPQLVENIVVVFNDQKFFIKQLASISVFSLSVILIAPWDKIYLEAIARAVSGSALGVNPAVDGNSIKITLPSLTEEKRMTLVKIVKGKVEETRVAVRHERDTALKTLKEMGKTISEDAKFKTKEKIQKEINAWNEKIEEIFKRKEEEIMKI